MATKSLGQLTLDLVLKTGSYIAPLNKSDRELEKWKRNAKQNIKQVTTAFAGLAAGASAAVTAIALKTLDSAKEIKNLSAVANELPGDFQKITYAAQRYNIEQEKVSDLLKDTSDKVGDFLQTGGGALADFFENIAPKVGVTADQFRNLSGSQALGLYVSSLEKANISQNEMTFYMEAIASDATLLLPLLRNNGEELKRLGKEAEDFGVILSDLEISQLLEVKENVDRLKGAFNGLAKDVTLSALPAVQELTNLLADEKTIAASKQLGEAIVTVMIEATKFIRGTIEAARFLGEEIAAIQFGISGDDIQRLERDAKKIRELLSSDNLLDVGERVRFFGPDGVIEYLSDEELKAKLAEIDSAIDAYYKNNDRPEIPLTFTQDVTDETGGQTPKSKTLSPLPDRDDNGVQKYLDKLQMEIDLIGKTSEAQELYKLKAMGATDAQLQQAKSALKLKAAYESVIESGEELDAIQEAINNQALAVAESLRTQEEIIEDSFQRQQEAIINSTIFTEQEKTDLMLRAAKERAEALQEIEDEKNAKLAEGYSVLLDVVGSYYDGLEGKQAAYARAAITIGQALLDKDKREALAEIAANTSAAAMKAYNALASIPYVGPALGAAAAGRVYVAGAAASARVLGVAHEGMQSVPKTGSYFLEAGERVTTEKTSAKLDATLDNVIQSNSNNNSGSGMPPQIVNLWDMEQIGDYMSSEPGQEIITNIVRANRESL